MRYTLLALAGTVGLALALGPAAAQDYGRYADRPNYDSDAPEHVEVIVPRYRERNYFGAPIIHASMSSRVYTGDLDLRSDWGAHRLKARLVSAAIGLCSQIDISHPAVAEDNAHCERYARINALQEADAAIHTVRGYPDE
jgi:UrcA family protein